MTLETRLSLFIRKINAFNEPQADKKTHLPLHAAILQLYPLQYSLSLDVTTSISWCNCFYTIANDKNMRDLPACPESGSILQAKTNHTYIHAGMNDYDMDEKTPVWRIGSLRKCLLLHMFGLTPQKCKTTGWAVVVDLCITKLKNIMQAITRGTLHIWQALANFLKDMAQSSVILRSVTSVNS